MGPSVAGFDCGIGVLDDHNDNLVHVDRHSKSADAGEAVISTTTKQPSSHSLAPNHAHIEKKEESGEEKKKEKQQRRRRRKEKKQAKGFIFHFKYSPPSPVAIFIMWVVSWCGERERERVRPRYHLFFLLPSFFFFIFASCSLTNIKIFQAERFFFFSGCFFALHLFPLYRVGRLTQPFFLNLVKINKKIVEPRSASLYDPRNKKSLRFFFFLLLLLLFLLLNLK